MLACLLLVVSAAIALSGGGGDSVLALDGLRARGWVPIDQFACASVRAGRFYEISNDEASAEVISLPEGGGLASHAPLPEAPYDCREISEPHFIEEIR